MSTKKAIPFLLLLASFRVFGQISPGILYENEHNIGLLVHTRGWGLNAQFVKHRTVDNYRLLDFGIQNVKHAKEVKLPNPSGKSSRPYVFGKLNSLICLNANIGFQRILADRVADNGVRLNLNYSIGPVLGILKPVYYDIELNSIGEGPQKVQARFDSENLLYQENTIGPSPFFKGLGESKFIGGMNGKASINFEWGPTDSKFYSLETGVMIQAFPREVPIFAYIKNQQVFTNLFLSLTYGSRK